MQKLPDGVKAYSKIGPFNQDTIPKGLLKTHNTKSGVWALLEVQAGQVRYVITEAEDQGEHILNNDKSGVIAPLHIHHLEIIEDVQFTVTFCK